MAPSTKWAPRHGRRRGGAPRGALLCSPRMAPHARQLLLSGPRSRPRPTPLPPAPPPQYHGQHALRDRARKIDEGILIIR
jgi:hypothetical protein